MPRAWGALFPLIPVRKVKGEEDNQDKEDSDGPEKPLGKSVPVLLGVEKYPQGDDQRNQIKKDKKESHPEFSPKPAGSVQLSAFS